MAGVCLPRGLACGGVAGSRFARGLFDRLLQFVDQLVERLRVLLQCGQPLRLILVLRIGVCRQLLLCGPLRGQRLGLLLALQLGRLQRLLLSGDRVLQVLQFDQIGHQLLHALHAVLLEIFRVHQRTGDPRHVFVTQQQAKVRALIECIGGSQQVGDRRVLAVQFLLQISALLLQLVQVVLLGDQIGVGLVHGPRRVSQRIGLLRQLGVDAVAACRGIGLLLRQRRHLAADIGELLLGRGLFGVALVVLLGGRWSGERASQQCAGDQAGKMRTRELDGLGHAADYP